MLNKYQPVSIKIDIQVIFFLMQLLTTSVHIYKIKCPEAECNWFNNEYNTVAEHSEHYAQSE